MTILVNLSLAIIVAATLWFFLSKRLLQSDNWRATVTPLASIIGSGFLVSVPLLSGSVGNWAIAAMAGLIVYAYFVGGAIRFNILYGEPIFVSKANLGRAAQLASATEYLSHIALAGAYFISVAYYLSLLAIFMLKGIGIENDVLARGVTTGILAFIGLFGLTRSLKGLERIEEYAVSLNLAAIATIIVALVGQNIDLALGDSWKLADLPVHVDMDTLRVLLGFIIVVQGFETSRFLDDEYPATLRVRTMRYAQLMSGVIYLVFFALATVMFRADLSDDGVAAIIEMVGTVALVLPLMLTCAAIASQFSASVADAIGGASLLHTVFRKAFALRYFYPVIAGGAIALVWVSDVFDIIALASRAFAFFYFLQCFVAGFVALATPKVERRWSRVVWYGLLGLVSLAAAIFGLPAEA